MVQPKRHKRAPRPRRTSARAPAETPDLPGLALVASAIGNIVQASKNKDLERERERLVAVLRDWQEAYQRLEERARALRATYEKVAEQLEKSEHERQRWHMKFLACEQELKAWAPVSTPTEEGRR